MDTGIYYIKNLFELGSYQEVVSALQTSVDVDTAEVIYLGARSYLALSPPNVAEARALLGKLEYPESVGARSIGLLADYFGGAAATAEIVSAEVARLLEAVRTSGSPPEETSVAFKVLGTLYVLTSAAPSGVVEEIPELLSIDQESLGIAVQALLQEGKHTQAERLVKESEVEDGLDSIQSQLFDARLSLFEDRLRAQSALYVFEEAKGMQGGSNEATRSGVPVAHAVLGQYDEAAKSLDSSATEYPKSANLSANKYVLSLKSGKSLDDAEHAMTELQSKDPSHVLVQKYAAAQDLFDGALQRFQVGLAE